MSKVTIRELRDEKLRGGIKQGQLADEEAANLVKEKLEELCGLINCYPELVFQYQLSVQCPTQIIRLSVYRRVLEHPPQAAVAPQ